MDIILKQYIKGLGDKDDVVAVKPGYARNYLIPKGLAILATESARKVVAENSRQAEHRKAHQVAEAENLAKRLSDTVLVIPTLAGVDGKLFGSITNLMIENRLKDEGFEIDRRRITVPEIRELGEFEVEIDIRKEVQARMKIQVVQKED